VERRLRCTCPCGLDIFTCRTTDFTCSYSPALHDEVLTLVRAGTGPEGVVAAFVAKYGERILLAPKPQGFGILGYVLPGTAIVLVAGVLAWVLIRRSRRPGMVPVQPAPAAPARSPVPAGSAEEMARLDRALEELDA
jgi:cytochrome c-type biogenesis protein CcmH